SASTTTSCRSRWRARRSPASPGTRSDRQAGAPQGPIRRHRIGPLFVVARMSESDAGTGVPDFAALIRAPCCLPARRALEQSDRASPKAGGIEIARLPDLLIGEDRLQAAGTRAPPH